MPQDSGTPEEHALFCDEVRQMRTILAGLPVQARVALEMHRFGGYNMEEIARHLGVSVASAHRLIKGSIAAITKEMK
ncbi:extracytoplasmic-function sigma-70 factor [compost metagenome]